MKEEQNINTENLTETNQEVEQTVEQSEETQEQELTLEEQLAMAHAELAQMELYVSRADERERDIILRAKAENENIRKRAENEVLKAHKFALEKFAKDLLSVADNLERATATLQDADPSLKDGVILTHKELAKVLEQHQIKAFGQVGELFDPEKHQAVSQMPAEGIKSNHISVVMQQGYTLNDRVIRDAMVAVAP